jgi:putative hydrolase of the HAD superfamily
MSKKKTVFFDAAGTLFYVSHGVGFHYSRIAEKYGVRVDPLYIDQRFHSAYGKASPMALSGKQAEKLWWRDLVRVVFEEVSFPQFDPFFDEVYSFFQQNENEQERAWTLFPETIEVLEHLQAKKYPMGLISNFDSRIESILKNLKIFHFFQTITYSSETGFAKPSIQIFQQALKKAGCTPKDAIHIGDHIVFDVQGAQNAGMQAFFIDRSGSKKTSNNVIRDLREIYANL